MDFYLILFWSIGVWCSFLIIQAILHHPLKRIGWILIASVVLSLLFLTYFYHYLFLFWLAVFVWGVFIFLPSIGLLFLNRLLYRNRFKSAYFLFRFLSFLHPFDGWRKAPFIYKALMLEHQGLHEEAKKLLSIFEKEDSDIGRSAMIRLMMMGSEWNRLIEWGEKKEHEEWLKKNFHYLPSYLRAYGEVGDFHHLLQTYAKWKKVANKFRDPILKNSIWLFIFAFCGRKDLVDRILNGALSLYPESQKNFWRATALWSSGNSEVARSLLNEMNASADPITQKGIERRLAEGVSLFSIHSLSESELKTLSQVEKEFKESIRYHSSYRVASWRPYCTYGLIVANLLVFLISLQGGSENPENLYRLGALFYVPNEVAGIPQVWRFITVNFLHLGLSHLFMNLIALFVIGPLLEHILGRLRFLICYFVSGIGAMILIFLVHLYYLKVSFFLVGASACIMGLVGGTAAAMLQDWRKENIQLAKKELRSMLMIILFQAALDFFVPEFSFMGHFFGAAIGFLVVLLLPRREDAEVEVSDSV